MNESRTLDRPAEYRLRDPEQKAILDRIKALEAQAKGHETVARGIRGELAVIKRQAGLQDSRG